MKLWLTDVEGVEFLVEVEDYVAAVVESGVEDDQCRMCSLKGLVVDFEND